DPLGLLLADLAQAGLVRHHALGPLAPTEAEELLADLLGVAGAAADQATVARVLERAGGTPFFLVSYAHALRAAGAGADAAVAAALEADPAGAPPELLAYHFARSDVPDKAVPYLEQAGDQAWAQRAYGAAERHYRDLLERLEALGRVPEALPVREKLGEVLYQ